MKTAFVVLTGVLLTFGLAVPAYALPFNMADKNPQVVAYYETGPHGVIPEAEYHEGADLVKRNGNSKSFQQWFYGTSESEGLHGEHSVWKVSKDGTCPANWTLVPDPYPEWGDYLEPNVDYCVMTNDFKPSN